MDNHRLFVFVMAVLYSMDQKWRGIDQSQSFEDVLRNRYGVSMQSAFLKLKKGDLLGEFAQDFHFDHLFATSTLNQVLSEAYVEWGLIRVDGNLNYHLDRVSSSLIEDLVSSNNIPITLVQRAAESLNNILEEQEQLIKLPAE